MKTPTYLYRFLAAVFGLVLLAATAFGGAISQVVVFGDSLSDNGNAFAAIGYPPAPYWNGRHSNGPVTPEYIAQKLHVPLVDFAFDGATTGQGDVNDAGGTVGHQVTLPGMTVSLGQYLGSHAVDPNALYIVWGGANDFSFIASPADAATIVPVATADILSIAGALRMMGATKVYVFGIPNLALTPKVKSFGPGAVALFDYVSGAYNAALKSNLPSGVRFFDTDALFEDMYFNPAKYGLTDVTDTCLVGKTVCANPGQYLFWDWFHPTTGVHSVVADSFLAAAVPEPATVYLAGIALALVAGRRIARRRAL